MADAAASAGLATITSTGDGAAGGAAGAAAAEILETVDALAAKVDATATKAGAMVGALSAMVDATATNVDALAVMVGALATKVDAMADAIAAAPQRDPAVLGSRTWERLVASTGRAGIFEFPGSAGPPVLTELQLSELLAACVADKKTGVVRYITPVLWDILTSISDEPSVSPLRHLLVNSETYGWLGRLEASAFRDRLQKPGLFLTWEPFADFGASFGQQGDGESFHFGPLAHRALQLDGCVPAIVEGTTGPLTDSDFGKVVGYHSRLPGRVNGLLCNTTDVWLTEACHGHVFRLETCQWGQPGTRELLQRHLAAVCRPPPLAVLLAKLLVDLDVTLPPLGTSSFLGAGAMGRVFTVLRGAQSFALKVVINTGSLLKLSNEFTLAETLASAGAPVMPVVADSFRMYVGLGGGYLMRAIGTRIPAVSLVQTRRVFDALQRVHASGVIHGDARLPNTVEVDDSVYWLDFFHASRQPATFTMHAKQDMLTLSASVLNVPVALLPASVQAAVAAYLPTESAQPVADAVWALKR